MLLEQCFGGNCLAWTKPVSWFATTAAILFSRSGSKILSAYALPPFPLRYHEPLLHISGPSALRGARYLLSTAERDIVTTSVGYMLSNIQRAATLRSLRGADSRFR